MWINSPYGSLLIPMAMKTNSVVHIILQVGGFIFLAQLVLLMLVWGGKNPLKYIPAEPLAGRQCHGATNEMELKIEVSHDDVIQWKYFPRYWLFVRGIRRWPLDSHHIGRWREALMFSLVCAWTKNRGNNADALCVGNFLEDYLHIRLVVSLF